MPSVAEIFKTMDYGPAPESDTEARAWLATHGAKFGHFVNGAWTKVGATFDVTDPSTNATLAKATQGTVKDVDADHLHDGLSAPPPPGCADRAPGRRGHWQRGRRQAAALDWS